MPPNKVAVTSFKHLPLIFATACYLYAPFYTASCYYEKILSLVFPFCLATWAGPVTGM
jgi:hypothetical protein